MNLPGATSDVNSCMQSNNGNGDCRSVCSSRSKSLSRLSSKSTSSIQEEAKRAALLVKAATLQKRHELEEHQELLRKRVEALEVQGELEAATAKISYLKKAETTMINPQADTREDESVQSDDLGYASHSVVKGAEDVNLKEGVGIQSTIPSYAPPFKDLTKPRIQVKSEKSTVLSTSQQSYADQDHNIAKVIENQNELTKILVKQHILSTLPKVDIPIFNGEILHYASFIHSFENMVERKTENNQERLQLLIQFTRGQAQRLVKSCEYMSPSKGYKTAKGLFKENFGNEYKISCAYMERANSWTVIKPEDSKALQDFAMFLRACGTAMSDMDYMEEFNAISNMRNIILKLPYKLREKWRTVAYELQEQRGCRVKMLDLIIFIEKQARIAADPAFRDIQGAPNVRGKVKVPVKLEATKAFGSSFVTEISSIHKTSKPEVICLFCNCKHSLEMSKSFMRKTHRERLTFLKENGICFGCLNAGHVSKECKNRLICRRCNQSHPSVLHIEQQVKREKQVEKQNDAIGNALVSPKACGHIGAGDQKCILSNVPVKVKAAKGSKVLEVYAFLDPGSSATFCTQRLMSQLNIKGRKTNILLRTMAQERSVPTSIISGLEVSALNDNKFLPLPDVFTQKEMPVTTDNIPRPEELSQWPYLKNVQLPYIRAEVELLIGTNAPKVMEPWEIVNSHDDGPYAVKTLLGWVVNGPLRVGQTTGNAETSVYVNRISVANLERLLISQYNQEFSEVTSEEKELSMEDKKFLEIVNESVVLQDNHYSLKLPFKEEHSMMPNNRHIAEQRLLSLKRKFKNSE